MAASTSGESKLEYDTDDDDEAPLLVSLEEEPQNQQQQQQVKSVLLDDDFSSLPPCPVTILSGFLGSGKTTLIQYILKSPHHGKRIAVIENEFGQGLDVESLIARDGVDNSSLTDLIELPNGCICCTVKDSLVATLENLLHKRRDLDYILIECSGMANPGPIASIFWLDDALESRLTLDGIVTLVDAKHIAQQLRETEEAAQQIAYADRILLNKTDLVESTEEILETIRKIHPTAPLRTTTYSTVPDLEWILDANCFHVDRMKDFEHVLEHAAAHHHQNELPNDSHSHDHDYHDTEEACPACLAATRHRHTASVSTIALTETGTMDWNKVNQWLASILWPNQDEHDKVLRGLVERKHEEGDDATETNLAEQRRTQQQIFRIKGILSIKDAPTDDYYGEHSAHDHSLEIDSRRFIVQAVHDLWEIKPASDGLRWMEDERRICKMVFIGKFLEERALRSSFRSCLVDNVSL